MLNYLKFQELYTVSADKYDYPVVRSALFKCKDTISLDVEAIDLWNAFLGTPSDSGSPSMDKPSEHTYGKKGDDTDMVEMWFMFSEEESLLQFYRDPDGKDEISLEGFSFCNDSILNHLGSKLDLFHFFEERKKLAFEEYIPEDYFTNLCMKEEGILYDFFRAAWVAYSCNCGKGNQVSEEDFKWYTRLPNIKLTSTTLFN